MSAFLLFILFLAIENVTSKALRSISQDSHLAFPQARQLSAATSTSHSKLKSRTIISDVLASKASFDYIHETDDHTEFVFATTLNVESRQPILVLEDVEPWVEDIYCSESQIHLSFSSLKDIEIFYYSLDSLSEFVIVTAHEGCDLDGERATHRVKGVSLDNNDLIVQKQPLAWKEAFHSTQVSFSRRHKSEIQKRSNVFAKRQQEESPSTTKVMTGSGATPTVSFPAVSSATSELPSSATGSLDKSIVDQVIFPPKVPVANQFIPQGVTVSCKNCTFEGSIEISQGSFNMSSSDGITDGISNTIDFFEHGSVQVIANDMFAQIELGLDLSSSQSLASLPISLPTIPLTPFEIPGVVAFGPLIQPQLNLSLSLQGEVGFTYGFNLSVPDDSSITVNMTDLSSSSISGFNETTFHALPFQSSSAILSLIMSASFTPQILLGISTIAGSATGGIGAFLELPKLSVNVTQLSNVNENCEPVSDNTSDGVSSALDNVFGNLTSIVPSVQANMGVLAEFEAEVVEFSAKAAAQYVLAETEYPLPTACLMFDGDGGKYVAPSKTSSTAGATGGSGAAAEGKDKEGGAVRVVSRPDLVSMGAVLVTFFAAVFCAWA